MSQVLILASSSTHDAYKHHTTHNNRNAKFVMKNLRVRGCFFFGVGVGEGGEVRFKLSDQKGQLMIMIRKWLRKGAFQDFLRLKIQMKRGPESMIQYVKCSILGFKTYTNQSLRTNGKEHPR
jgi:hypothetical protein